VIAIVRLHRPDDRPDFAVEDRVFKLRNISAATGPAQFAALAPAGGIDGYRAGQLGEGLAFRQRRQDILRFFFGADQDLPHVHLLFDRPDVSRDSFLKLRAQHLYLEDRPDFFLAHAGHTRGLSQVFRRDFLVPRGQFLRSQCGLRRDGRERG